MAGHEGEHEGAAVVADAFREAGLRDVGREPFGIPGWWRGSSTLTTGDASGRDGAGAGAVGGGRDVGSGDPSGTPATGDRYEQSHEVVALPGTPAGEVTGPVVDVGYGRSAAFDAADVDGAVVLVSSETPAEHGRWIHRMEKYAAAVEGGAAAFVFHNHVDGALPPTGEVGYGNRPGPIPAIGVSKEVGARLRRHAADWKPGGDRREGTRLGDRRPADRQTEAVPAVGRESDSDGRSATGRESDSDGRSATGRESDSESDLDTDADPGRGLESRPGPVPTPGPDPVRGIGEGGDGGTGDAGLTATVAVDCENAPATSLNVRGDLGPETDEVVLVTAHHDAHDLSEGAVDNAAGCALVAEVGRLLVAARDAGLEFGCRVRCETFGAEEIGLRGAAHAAAGLDPDDVRCVLNADGIARGRDLRGVTNGHTDLERVLVAAATALGQPLTTDATLLPHGDQWAFVQAGVPGVILSGSDPDDRGRGWGHTHADTLDKVDARDLRTHATFVAEAAARAAAPGASFEHRSREAVRDALDPGYEHELRVGGRWPFDDPA